MSGVFIVNEDHSLIKMKQAEYLSEDELQLLIARHPALIAGCTSEREGEERRLLLVKREMGVPDREHGGSRWSMDHFYIDDACVPTLVEVKRSKDARIRREVVGQMLDYAANSVAYCSIDNIKDRFKSQWADQADEKLEEFLQDSGMDEPTFWDRVNTNLQAGEIRLVFVADELPPELKSIIEFLNGQMKNTEMLGVELRNFTDGRIRAIAPSIIGRTSQAAAAKGTQRSYPELDLIASEFHRLTSRRFKVTGGKTAHYRKVSMGRGIDPDVHFEFAYSAKHGVTCEFHVEGKSNSRLTQTMVQLANEIPDIAGSPLQYFERTKRPALRVTPQDPTSATNVAETMLALISATDAQLRAAL